MNKAFTDFVSQHLHDDPVKLLLSADRYPNIDMTAAVQQIEGLQSAQEKWPTLAHYPEFRFPPRRNREQSSSEAAARYKATLIPSVKHLADLTGGMGVDCWQMSKVCDTVDYVECDERVYRLACENFAALGIENIRCHHADSMEWIAQQKVFDVLYIDPSRRDTQGERKFAFQDCQPNIVANRDLLQRHCQRMLIKASPMLDIQSACQQIGPTVTAVHILQIGGECKELLFVTDCDSDQQPRPIIHCVDLSRGLSDLFDPEEEIRLTPVASCHTLPTYLYDPYAAWMKSGCFKTIAQRYALQPLDHNSHLYGSDRLNDSFPGRIFRVLHVVKANRKSISKVVPEGCAHVIVRNFPSSAAVLQHQLGLKEGGQHFIIATTFGGKHLIVVAERVLQWLTPCE